jgi:signal peptidase I
MEGRPPIRSTATPRPQRADPPVVRPPILRQRGRKRPPLTLPIARLARWPRPFGALLLMLVALVGAFVWPVLVWLVVGIWAVMAAAAVLDARLRGRIGILAGVVAAIFGPIALLVSSLAFRRAVRKVTPRYGSAVPIALIVAIAAGFLCHRGATFVVDHLADTITVPNPAMAPDVRQGDRIVVSHRDAGDVHRGDIVLVKNFARAEAALGRSGPYAGVFRVIGLQGEWIGATDDGLYRCTKRPDVSDGVTRSDGCVFPDETTYAAARTIPFGPVRVDNVSFFVMGDNRTVGGDSREFGSVPIDDIEGVVVATLWPLERLGVR